MFARAAVASMVSPLFVRPRRGSVKLCHLLLGLIPWILFSMTAERLDASMAGYAALAAFLGSLALTVAGAFTDGLKLIDVAGAAVLGAATVLALAGGPSAQRLLVEYGGCGAALALAAVMFVSALTVQYTRAGVHRRYWGSPTFRMVNHDMSMLWAVVVLAMAVCHLLAGVLGTGGLLLDLILPAVLVFGGLKGTHAIANKAGMTRQMGARP
jgi:hypothetical protein